MRNKILFALLIIVVAALSFISAEAGNYQKQQNTVLQLVRIV